MINYFYNIILKTDECDLYSDVLTSIRKDFYISKEKQKGKITQNSSGDSLFYNFSLEKDKAMKWSVSNDESIFSETKILTDGQYSINYYNENGLYKTLTFSKFHTLLKIEYFNLSKTTVPYCVMEPRKANNSLCIMLFSRTETKPSVLFAMPEVQDDYIMDKVDSQFEDYTVIASTNEGMIKFLSETQLVAFNEFVEKAEKTKAEDIAPESFIDDDDAALARKLNPKDFNVKRNLSEIVDISQAQEFSYDNIEEELVSDLELDLSDELVEEVAKITDNDTIDAVETEYPAEIGIDEESVIEDFTEVENDAIDNDDVDDLTCVETFDAEMSTPEIIDDEVNENIEEVILEGEYVAKEDVQEDIEIVNEDACIVTVEEADLKATFDDKDIHDEYIISEFVEPDSVIDGRNAKYLYYGELNSDNKRDGFGRTATEDGRTAYEGEYSNNKRNGIGAYYYKDSGLCYYGQWKDNKREGVGVGVSSLDKSIHVGKFSANKPCGDGVRIEENGDIRFIKKVLSNGITVEFKFENDKVIVVKYNENGDIISENTSNLMYF